MISVVKLDEVSCGARKTEGPYYMENLGFSTSGLCSAFKIFLAFFQFFWPSDVLIIQNHSNLSYFEAILPLKQFLLKIWQSGSV